MNKKIIAAISAAAALSAAITASAGTFTPSNYATDLKVYLNGDDVYAGSENKPCIMNDRAMVQVRPIFEKLGYTAEYDDATKTAVFYPGANAGHNVPISFTDDSYVVSKLSSEDGSVAETYNFDVPATLYNDVFYVPLRAFCETVGSEFITIDWDDVTRSVYLNSFNQTANTGATEFSENTDTLVEGEYFLKSAEDSYYIATLTVKNVSNGQATISITPMPVWAIKTTCDLKTAYLQPDGSYIAEGTETYTDADDHSKDYSKSYTYTFSTANNGNTVVVEELTDSKFDGYYSTDEWWKSE